MRVLNVILIMSLMFFLAACAAADQDGESAEASMNDERPFEAQELARGGQSQATGERLVVVRDQAALEQNWRLTGKQGGAPEVDFDQDMVVALFMGERRTGGYAIRLDQASRDGDGATLSVLMQAPGEGCMTTQAITSPYQLLRLPRVEGEVNFEIRQETVDC